MPLSNRNKIVVYLQPDEKAWIEHLALENSRSLSNQARLMLLKDYHDDSAITVDDINDFVKTCIEYEGHLDELMDTDGDPMWLNAARVLLMATTCMTVYADLLKLTDGMDGVGHELGLDLKNADAFAHKQWLLYSMIEPEKGDNQSLDKIFQEAVANANALGAMIGSGQESNGLFKRVAEYLFKLIHENPQPTEVQS